MLNLIRSIPSQLNYGWLSSKDTIERIDKKNLTRIVICGVGGSGIAGDLLRGLLYYDSSVSIEVLKDYTLPLWIKEDHFGIAISYSGNTEETLSAWDSMRRRGLDILAITSGGTLEDNAIKQEHPIVRVPPGNPPRASIGYLFAPLLRLSYHWNLYDAAQSELEASIDLINSRTEHWEAEMRSFAEGLKNTLPIIHTLDASFSAIGYRLSCQLNENAKMIAHSSVYPEMNHNEIVGYEGDIRNLAIVVINPGVGFANHRNIVRREIVLRRIIPESLPVFSIDAEGGTRLERFISLLVKVDLLSFFLASVRGVDPFRINSIERLKKELS